MFQPTGQPFSNPPSRDTDHHESTDPRGEVAPHKTHTARAITREMDCIAAGEERRSSCTPNCVNSASPRQIRRNTQVGPSPCCSMEKRSPGRCSCWILFSNMESWNSAGTGFATGMYSGSVSEISSAVVFALPHIRRLTSSWDAVMKDEEKQLGRAVARYNHWRKQQRRLPRSHRR